MVSAVQIRPPPPNPNKGDCMIGAKATMCPFNGCNSENIEKIPDEGAMEMAGSDPLDTNKCVLAYRCLDCGNKFAFHFHFDFYGGE